MKKKLKQTEKAFQKHLKNSEEEITKYKQKLKITQEQLKK